MSTLTQLNSYSNNTIEFTDNRPSNVIFDYPTARNINRTLTGTIFTLETLINIVDIIKAAEANITFSVDLSSVSGSTINWGTLPTGVSQQVVGDVYTLLGISTVQDWEDIKDPTINAPADFQGNFIYNCTIAYTQAGERKTQTWQVGNFIPVGLFEAEFTSNIFGNAVRNAQISMRAFITSISFAVDAILNVISNINIVGNRLRGLIATSLSSTITQTVSGEQIYIGLSPAQGTMTYSTNTNFTVENQPLIYGPDTGDITITITPSDVNAIDNINETDPNISLSLAGSIKNLGNTGFSRFGDYMEANDSFILVGNNTYLNGIGIAYLYNHSNTLLHTFSNPFPADGEGWGARLAISDDYVAIGSGDKVYIYNTSDYSLKRIITTPYSSSVDIAGNLILIGNKLYSISTGNLLNTFTAGDRSALSADYVAIIDNVATNNVKIYNTFDYSLEYTITTSTADTNTASLIDITDNYFAVADENYLELYDLTNGNKIWTNISGEMEYFGQPVIATNRVLVWANDNSVPTDQSYYKIYGNNSGNLVYTLTNISNGVDSAYMTDTKLGIGDYSYNWGDGYYGKVTRYNITENSLVSINGSKVITAIGTKDELTTLFDNDRVVITPSTGYSSNFTFTYVASQGGQTGTARTQQVIRV